MSSNYIADRTAEGALHRSGQAPGEVVIGFATVAALEFPLVILETVERARSRGSVCHGQVCAVLAILRHSLEESKNFHLGQPVDGDGLIAAARGRHAAPKQVVDLVEAALEPFPILFDL